MDWREWGIIRPINDQGLCGSCYAFSTAHSIESVNAIRSGKVYHVSKQHIVDCCDSEYCSACEGASVAYANKFLFDSGSLYAEDVYPYVSGADGIETDCNADNLTEIDPSEVYITNLLFATNLDYNMRADLIKSLLV